MAYTVILAEPVERNPDHELNYVTHMLDAPTAVPALLEELGLVHLADSSAQ